MDDLSCTYVDYVKGVGWFCTLGKWGRHNEERRESICCACSSRTPLPGSAKTAPWSEVYPDADD